MAKKFFTLAFFLLSTQVLVAEDSSSGSSSLDFANGLYARKMYATAISEYEKFIQANPTSPEIASARFREADSYYFNGNYNSSIRYFEDFIKAFPQDKRVPMAQFRIATANFHEGRLAPAVKIFLQLSKESGDPNIQSGSLFYLGKSFDTKAKSEKSLETFEEILKKFPNTEYASYASVAMGDHYLKQNKLEQSIASYQVAAAKEEPYEIAKEAQFKLAQNYMTKNEYVDAASYYEKVFKSDPLALDLDDSSRKRMQDLRAQSLLALFYCDYFSRKLDQAKARLLANKEYLAKNQSIEPEILYLMGVLCSDEKNFEEAITYLDQVIAHSGAQSEFREKALFKKSAVLTLTNKRELSLEILGKIFSSNSSKNQARALYEKAKILQELDRADEALKNYDTLVANYASTDYAKLALYESALLRLKIHELKIAKESFIAYAKKYPTDVNADKALLEATQIDLDMKNYSSALETINLFFEKFPQSALLDIGFYKKGIVFTALKKFDEAASFFQKIKESSRFYPESLYGQGANLEESGKIKEALPFYEKLVNFYPDHALSPDVLSREVYLCLKLDLSDKAATLLEDILANKPQVKIYPDEIFWLLQYCLDRSEYERMQKILALLPSHFSALEYHHEILFYLGESYMGLKDYPKALEFYSKSIETNAQGYYVPHAYLGKGLALLATGDFTQAQMNFNEAVKYDDEVKVAMRARFELAGLWLRSADYLEAAKAFMLVAILYDDPKITPLSLYKAGECFSKLGRTAEANRAFAELKKRYPQSTWTKEIKNLENPNDIFPS